MSCLNFFLNPLIFNDEILSAILQISSDTPPLPLLKQLNPHPALPSLSLKQCPLDSPSPILHKNSLQISPEIELYWLEKTDKKPSKKAFLPQNKCQLYLEKYT